MHSGGPTFLGPRSWNYYGAQPATIGQYATRLKGPGCRCKDLEALIAENMVVGGVLENGPYSGLLPTSNEVWVTAVMVLNGVVPWQIITIFF